MVDYRRMIDGIMRPWLLVVHVVPAGSSPWSHELQHVRTVLAVLLATAERY